MPKKVTAPREHWKSEPEEHDFPAAGDYLSLLFRPADVEAIVAELRTAPTMKRKAKDLLRASRLKLLSSNDIEVARDFKKVDGGERLSPVLLVRNPNAAEALIIADGYHRICASYHLDEGVAVACRIVEVP